MTNGHFKQCVMEENCWCEIKRYGLVFCIAIIILVVEIIGGFLTHSIALMSDAGHVFTDTIATLITIIVAYRVKHYPLMEITTRKLGGYINATLLGIMAIWIGFEAYDRLWNPHKIASGWMTIVAVIGMIGNIIQHKIITSVNENHATHDSMKLHVFSDLLQSVGVVCGGFIIMVTEWTLIDPIVSIIISLLMFRWTINLIRNLWSGRYDEQGHCSHS